MSRGGRGGSSTHKVTDMGRVGERDKTINGGVQVENPGLAIEKVRPEDFPRPDKVQPPLPPTKIEKDGVVAYRHLRDRVRDGPLFSDIGDDTKIGEKPPPPAATFDPFEGQPTYSNLQYRKERRKLPKIQKCMRQFLPEELWETAGGSGQIRKNKKHKLLMEDREAGTKEASKRRRLDRVFAEAEAGTSGKDENPETEEREVDNEREAGAEKDIPPLDDDDEEREEDEAERDLEEDDDFEDDEDDDYNAQQHFEFGERDEDLGDLDGDGGYEEHD
ncbi:MAG: hypothetical protein M1820_005547 [Bogoriella megaspora]|nr:MAG: hypothetical protein M1820_005547 [Bogoriella megaspora]